MSIRRSHHTRPPVGGKIDLVQFAQEADDCAITVAAAGKEFSGSDLLTSCPEGCSETDHEDTKD